MTMLRAPKLLVGLAVIATLLATSACSRDVYYTNAGCAGVFVVGASKAEVLVALRKSAEELGYSRIDAGEIDSSIVLRGVEPERMLILGEALRSEDYFAAVSVLDPNAAVAVSLDSNKIVNRLKANLPPRQGVFQPHACSSKPYTPGTSVANEA